MIIVNQSYEILTPIDPDFIYKHIEKVARTCYKSEDKITDGSAERMLRALIKNDHMAMLEHFSISVKFVTDRGVANEIVRHRNCSFAQESTRYCRYDNDLRVVRPTFNNGYAENSWLISASRAEQSYKQMLNYGMTPELARSVLPLCTKTEIVVTTNIREWRHIFELRVLGTTGKPHPQIKELMEPLLKEFGEKLPVLFGDLSAKLEENN